MRFFKNMKWDALLKGILCLLLGISAALIPDTMNQKFGRLLAVVLIVAGAVSMVAYLLREAEQNYYHNDFSYGLLGITAGVIAIYKIEVVTACMPILLGVVILSGGFDKLQNAIDAYRMHFRSWCVFLVMAILHVGLGIVFTCKPLISQSFTYPLIAAALLFAGITDVIMLIWFAFMISDAQKKSADAANTEAASEKREPGKQESGKQKTGKQETVHEKSADGGVKEKQSEAWQNPEKMKNDSEKGGEEK